MQRSTWEYVLLIVLIISGSLTACTAQEAPPDADVLADSVQSGRTAATPTDGRTVKERLEDATIAAEVQKALLDTMSLRRFDFEVAAARGRVALRGSVYTETERTLAAKIARDVDGVRDLINQIALFPPDSAAVQADSTSKKPL